MSLIKDVQVNDNYCVLVNLNNGNSMILDMSSKLDTIRFIKLNNKDVFKRVYTDGSSIYWSNGQIRMSFTEMIEMLRSNVVDMFIAV